MTVASSLHLMHPSPVAHVLLRYMCSTTVTAQSIVGELLCFFFWLQLVSRVSDFMIFYRSLLMGAVRRIQTIQSCDRLCASRTEPAGTSLSLQEPPLFLLLKIHPLSFYSSRYTPIFLLLKIHSYLFASEDKPYLFTCDDTPLSFYF